MHESMNEPGGSLPPSLPSPAPSSASHSSTLSNLPHPRSHPLRAGSAKEEAARRYVEGRLLHISRRYTKKFQPPQEGEDANGYTSMSEASTELGEVVDILWLSGTPSLQIPYLLSVALTVASYLPAFPAAPQATFALIRKLDHAFASLLSGEDTITGEALPGFDGGKRLGMSRTDMVRVKSIVEATRVLIVEVMSKEIEEESEMEESGAETDDMSVDLETGWDAYEEKHNMDVARVYDSTILQLGELLQDTV